MISRRHAGFTFFEMTMVMVIIALLIAALIVGQDLFAAARNRGIIKEFNSYQRAISLFRDKYNALPGDMSNPVKYWPLYSWSMGGNGNGTILWQSEGPRAWKQIELAGLLPEGVKYIGTNYSCTSLCPGLPGGNMPESSIITGAGWSVGVAPHMRNLNMLLLGKRGTGYSLASTPAISPNDTKFIDTKIDDGKPFEGSMRAKIGTNYVSNTCIITSVSTPYYITSDIVGGMPGLSPQKGCSFYVALGF